MAGDPADAKIDWHFKGNSLTADKRIYIQELINTPKTKNKK
jgi:hypothetical protein